MSANDMHKLERTIRDVLLRFVDANGANGRPQPRKPRASIGLSGGIDSMVLLHALSKLRDADEIAIELDALHVHHGLSPNADQWAAFCETECKARSVACTIARVHVSREYTDGQGVEGAARRARYAAFVSHAEAQQSEFVLAAQHADDQAETVLHQLLRGTGLNGLAGMGESRALSEGVQLIRPMLTISRAEIETYAQEEGVDFITDESNDDTAYTRNFLRHDVLPTIKARFPHASDAIARAANHAADAAELNEALAKIDLRWDATTRSAFATDLDALDRTRQTNALYHWLCWQGVAPPSHAQLHAWAEQIFRASPTDKPHRAGGHAFTIRRKGDWLGLE
jgi:tRNA(Ile)-lysidine synthase